MTHDTSAQFVSEALRPIMATVDPQAMASGAPGLPQQFAWRDTVLAVARVDRVWRESGPCRHGSGERYARKHWFEVTTTTGAAAKIYFERTVRGRQRLARWWLYSLASR